MIKLSSIVHLRRMLYLLQRRVQTPSTITIVPNQAAMFTNGPWLDSETMTVMLMSNNRERSLLADDSSQQTSCEKSQQAAASFVAFERIFKLIRHRKDLDHRAVMNGRQKQRSAYRTPDLVANPRQEYPCCNSKFFTATTLTPLDQRKGLAGLPRICIAH